MIKNYGVLSQVEEKDLKLLEDNPAEFWKDVSQIGSGAFSYLKIKEIEIPGKVFSIGHDAFAECYNLKKVVLHRGLKFIDFGAFSNCEKLKDITLPDTIIGIDEFAFEVTAITHIRIPEGVQMLDCAVFSYCYSLEEVYLPQSLEEIDVRAFEMCSSLKKVVMCSTTKYSEDTFQDCPHVQIIKYNPTKQNTINQPKQEKQISKSEYKNKQEAKQKINDLFNEIFNKCEGRDL